jgi:putative DNA primase/helicase
VARATRPQPVPFRPNTRTVNDVLDALKAQILISGDLHAPEWLVEGSNPAATEVLLCRNGLLCLSTGELLRHTPDFLGMNALDFDYEPEVMAPHWERFLEEILPGDREAIETLQ